MTEIKEVIERSFIDRDNAKWKVDEDEYEGQPVLRLSVSEEDAKTKSVVFHKDDAPFIAWLIEQAAK
jgi:hypothetical protein